MTNSIKAICSEYTDDFLFSQDSSPNGSPLKIIVNIKYEYIPELIKFLHNYGYRYTTSNQKGKYYSFVHFNLVDKSILDFRNSNSKEEI